jgi:hypothetical protein
MLDSVTREASRDAAEARAPHSSLLERYQLMRQSFSEFESETSCRHADLKNTVRDVTAEVGRTQEDVHMVHAEKEVAMRELPRLGRLLARVTSSAQVLTLAAATGPRRELADEINLRFERIEKLIRELGAAQARASGIRAPVAHAFLLQARFTGLKVTGDSGRLITSAPRGGTKAQ